MDTKSFKPGGIDSFGGVFSFCVYLVSILWFYFDRSAATRCQRSSDVPGITKRQYSRSFALIRGSSETGLRVLESP
ncbi:MAG: hypothetical protein R3225_10255, partial [Halofilum sp. (in: g-proteobacteria)]|nr:hypothetical protein [Halofilum sp. (in: g-proteobacteria)]